jgi:phosphoglycolate phosphatase-like HAD superfamily hydrolase
MYRFRHLMSTVPIADLQRRLRAADLALVDLDGSLLGGITQGLAALAVFAQVAMRPERLADRRFLLPLALTGIGAVAIRAHYGRFHAGTFLGPLIRLWCWGFRGVPVSYFRRAASRLPRRSFPGVRRTLRRLAEQGPVGIISVGLDQVVHEFVRHFTDERGSLITFHRANRMLVELREGRMVYSGRYAAPMILSSAEKAEAGRALLDQYGARRPLFIGNDEGDLDLAALVRARGGLTLAVHPPRRLRRRFHAYLARSDWSPLADLLA